MVHTVVAMMRQVQTTPIKKGLWAHHKLYVLVLGQEKQKPYLCFGQKDRLLLQLYPSFPTQQ